MVNKCRVEYMLLLLALIYSAYYISREFITFCISNIHSLIAPHNGAIHAPFEDFLIFGKIGIPAMGSSAFRRSRLTQLFRTLPK